MTWIQTRGGRAVDLLNPQADTIDFNDVAYALSMLCRFTGHVKAHYSVAEHSVRVANILPADIRIYGLLHDAHEAYVNDQATPVKAAMSTLNPTYSRDRKWLETGLDMAIYTAAGVLLPNPHIHSIVKHVDTTLLVTERRDLLGPSPRSWGPYEAVSPLQETIVPWPAFTAEVIFIDMLRRLVPSLANLPAIAA